MAMCDYYLCDVCQQKAFYDADIPDRFEKVLMTALCSKCAETHSIKIEKHKEKEPKERAGE